MFYNPFAPALSRNDIKHYPCENSSKLLWPVQTGNAVNAVRKPRASLRYNASRIATPTAPYRSTHHSHSCISRRHLSHNACILVSR